MKSIGLYGDSFGSASLPKINGKDGPGMEYHWSRLLEKETNVSVTNYSESGASIYHCYKLFLDTYHLHDTIIFLITIPGRYFQSLNFESDGVSNIVSLPHLELFAKTKKLTDAELDTLNDLRGWYKSSKYEHDVNMSLLMVENVNRLHPNVTFVQCTTWVPAHLLNKLNLRAEQCLYTLYKDQMALLGLNSLDDNIKWAENPNYISGHFTPEINELFYQFLKIRLVSGLWGEWDASSVLFDANSSQYYKKL